LSPRNVVPGLRRLAYQIEAPQRGLDALQACWS
jgi:hypothetical protein